MDSNIKELHPHTNDKKGEDELAYKMEQKKRLGKFVIDGTDHVGYRIDKILAKGDEYVIYEVSGLPPQESIRVYIDTIKEEDCGAIDRFNEIKPHFDEFLSILFKFDCDVSYKKRASAAITMAVSGKLDEAKTLFDKIKNDAQQEYKEKTIGRLSYQGGAIFLSVLLTLCSSILYTYRLSDVVQNNLVLYYVILASTFASLGGFLSVSLKMKELTIDRGLNKATYFLYGAERILISSIGGVFTYILIKSNLALGFLGDGQESIYGIMAFCLLAGFSETFIPNALKNLEPTSESSNKALQRTSR